MGPGTPKAQPALSFRECKQSRGPPKVGGLLPRGTIGGLTSQPVHKACECFGVDFDPRTTTTTSTIVRTVTSTTATPNLPAETAIPTVILKTQYYDSSGTYVAAGKDTYTQYTGFDFKGYDTVTGNRESGNEGKLVTNQGNFTCAGFDGYQDVCTKYNDALAKNVGTGAVCKGVTWQKLTGYCYLKICL